MRTPISRRDPIRGEFNAPSSKPLMQRALIMATLSEGLSMIHRPLAARETSIMIEACRSLGAEISVLGDRLDVRGIGSDFGHNRSATHGPSTRYIWAGGSALVARLFLTLGAAFPESFIIDGNCNLRGRPFGPLIEALRYKSVEFDFFDAQDCLPCTAMSTTLPGGHYKLSTDISSQFITSLLISAPLAESPLSIELAGSSHSISYIKQTITTMSYFGVAVDTEDDFRQITVQNGQSYVARDIQLTGDYTAASYIIGAAFITRGQIRLDNLDRYSLQGESAIIDILARLGADIQWAPEQNALQIDCTGPLRRVNEVFDLADCPNILPTVAAISATVPGRVRIVGGRLTQNHKSPRVEAMAAELSKAGASVKVLKDKEGLVDGLEIKGVAGYEGGTVFSSHGDHRIAMATMLFTLACRRPCTLTGAFDTADSFPGFVDYLGLVFDP